MALSRLSQRKTHGFGGQKKIFLRPDFSKYLFKNLIDFGHGMWLVWLQVLGILVTEQYLGGSMVDASEGDNELLQRLMLLKNGSQHPALPAYVNWRSLHRVHEYHLADLKQLYAIATSGDDAVSEVERTPLLAEYRNWFDKQGRMNLLTRDIIRSSVRDTADGLVIVEPFQIRNDLDRTAIEEVKQRDQTFLRRLFERLDSQDVPPRD